MSDEPILRFEAFADARSAQAAFEALYPPGSPLDRAVQALVDMGASCKSAGPACIACRYVESERALAGWCWHIVLDGDRDKLLQRVRVNRAILAV